jgi:hypothetical protein
VDPPGRGNGRCYKTIARPAGAPEFRARADHPPGGLQASLPRSESPLELEAVGIVDDAVGMASAMVGSPMTSCQRQTRIWLMMRVAPRPVVVKTYVSPSFNPSTAIRGSVARMAARHP